MVQENLQYCARAQETCQFSALISVPAMPMMRLRLRA